MNRSSKSRWKKVGGVLAVALIVGLWNLNPAYAYVERTGAVGTAGQASNDGNGITGGDDFRISYSNDPSLEGFTARQDIFKYAPDGAPISNGNDTDGGLWMFDHVNGTNGPITSNNGYLQIGTGAASAWINALNGDSSYVNAHGLYETDFVDQSTGQTFYTYSLPEIAAESGASFLGQTAYNSTVYATDPPTASMDFPSGSTVTQGTSVGVNLQVTAPAYNANYHYEYLQVVGANGQDYTSQAVGNLQGYAVGSQTLDVTLQHGNDSGQSVQMQEISGGRNAGTIVNGTEGYGSPNYIHTSNLPAQTYTAYFYVKDYFNREATVVSQTFTVNAASQPSNGNVSVTLNASPSQTTVGNSSTLSARVSGLSNTGGLPNGDSYAIEIVDQGGNDTLDGSNDAYGNFLSPTAQATATSNAVRTENYVAEVIDEATYQTVATSNRVTVQWQNNTTPTPQPPPSSTQPTVSLSANPTQLPVGNQTELTATTTTLPSGDYLVIWDETTGQESTNSGLPVDETRNNFSLNEPLIESSPTRQTFVAMVSPSWQNANSQYIAESSPVTVQWTQVTVTINANPTTLPIGQGTNLTAAITSGYQNGMYVAIYNQHTEQYEGGGAYGSTATASVTENSPQTDDFVGVAWNGSPVGHPNPDYASTPVAVQWIQPQQQVSVTLSANPTNLLTGQATSLTATITSGYQADTNGNGMYLKIYDETTGQYLPGGFASTITDTDTQNAPTTNTYIAYVTMYQNGFVSQNNAYQSHPVSVTWNQPQPQPQPQPSGGGWQCGPNDSDTLTWWAVVGDSIEQFQATYNTTVDQGVVSGLLDDPGTPSDMWLPIPASEWNTQAQGSGFWAPLDQEHGWTGYEQGGPNASQVVRQFSDGNELVKIFGSPEAGGNPMVYVRPDAAFGLREVWTGSPHSMPTSGVANFTMTNPDGSYVTWTEPMTIDTATAVNNGDTPNGTTPPPYATEAVSVFTTIPKFTFRGGVQTAQNAELAAWSLSNDPTTVAQNSAHISVTLRVTNACGTSDHTINNVAILFSYPDWYFVELTNNNLAQQASH